MEEAPGVTRRELLKRVVIGAGAGIVAGSGLVKAAPAATTAKSGSKHLAWTWQFKEDGDPEEIREVLSHNDLGIILKTHDGADWMARWDESRHGIGGPAHVSRMAAFFEERNVPFHAWAVVEGLEPIVEARMCSDVLNSGARTLTLDLEPREGRNYWQGGPREASAFGQELRRLQPAAWITVAPDARPWQLQNVPIAEFAAISNEIAPQLYWQTFDSPTNHRLLREFGLDVSEEGLTPELLLDMSQLALAQYQRPIRPIGQGAADLEAWERFVRRAYELGMPGVSVWRYGTSDQTLWPFLRDQRAPEPEPPAPRYRGWRPRFGWSR